MRAIGRNLVIEKIEQHTKQTEGGLLLAELHREDVRYIKAKVFEVGSEVQGVKKNDIIYYDRHAGHVIEFESKTFNVIKSQDVVVVL
jgi:co-chaperonin GroES (HSP10)|tara:strand:+ start:1592 stop:1852 length:261 start_codon:yes stop_codon:yes gene_type:complete